LIFILLHLSRAFCFGSCTHVFLSGKAKTEIKTRQVFQTTWHNVGNWIAFCVQTAAGVG